MFFRFTRFGSSRDISIETTNTPATVKFCHEPRCIDLGKSDALIFCNRGNQDDRRHIGNEHGQNVLQAKRNCLSDRNEPVKPIDVIDSGTFHGRGSHDICLPLVFLGSFSLPLEFA